MGILLSVNAMWISMLSRSIPCICRLSVELTTASWLLPNDNCLPHDTWVLRLPKSNRPLEELYWLLLKVNGMTNGIFEILSKLKCCATGFLSLIHISEPTRQAEISYAVFC